VTNSTARTGGGRFAAGNRGGPGRPRRAVETDYLRTLTEDCPLERWSRIVHRAVDDAETGDAKAREWLARYLIGTPSANALTELAARDEVGKDAFAERVKALRLSPMDRLVAEVRGEL
jgi:hypothetical protein